MGLSHGVAMHEGQICADAGPDALMVSCDEMRDHLFQLLAPKYFKKWKQRHQVYYRQALASPKLCHCKPGVAG